MESLSSLKTADLFIRRSSGLVREIGARDAFAIGVGSMSLAGAFATIAVGLGLFPNSDFLVPLLVAGAIWLVTALAYWQLTVVMPKSGGDYVYASRLFTPAVGAIVGVAILVELIFSLASNGITAATAELPFSFTSLGNVFNSSALTDFGTTIATPNATFIFTVILIVIVGLLCTQSIRRVALILFWGAILQIVGFLIVIGLFLSHSQADFQSAFNSFSGHPGAYASIIAAAQKSGFTPGVTLVSTLATVPFCWLLYEAFTFPNLTGGELKKPRFSYGMGVVGLLLLSVLLIVIAWVAMERMAGLDFLQSSGWLYLNQPNVYNATTTPILPTGMLYALMVASDPVTKTILAFAFPAAHILSNLALMLVITRIIFALAFDRLLPTRLADVSPSTHSPVVAVIVATIGGIIFAIMNRYSSLGNLFTQIVLLTALQFFVISLAAMILPWRNRELWNSSPKVIGNASVAGVPVLAIVSAVAAIGNASMVVVIATRREIVGTYTPGSVATLLIMLLVGPVVYVIARLINRSRGLDIRLAMRELPPD